MKRRRTIVISAAVLLVIGVAVDCLTSPIEPTYKGRKLTSYLRGPWEQVDGPQEDNPHFGPDIVAIRAIGTNGIPTLLRLVAAHDPPWKARAISWLNSQKIVHVDIRDARRRRELGVLGFYILGEIAKPAAPDLVRLTNHRDPAVRMAALQGLMDIPAGKHIDLEVLSRMIHDPDDDVEEAAAADFLTKYREEAETAGARKHLHSAAAIISLGLQTNAPSAK
jgi:hypothetical protein